MWESGIEPYLDKDKRLKIKDGRYSYGDILERRLRIFPRGSAMFWAADEKEAVYYNPQHDYTCGFNKEEDNIINAVLKKIDEMMDEAENTKYIIQIRFEDFIQ